jgi:FixJ family two-component response regulator
MTTDDDSGWENIPSPEPAVDPDEARELVDALMGRAGLTTREIAILKRLAKDEKPKRIAQRLGITTKEVEKTAATARSKIRAVAKQGEGL